MAPHARPPFFSEGLIILSQWKDWLTRLYEKEGGPTAVEYAVMLALIIFVCITAIQALGTNANTTFNTVG